MADRHNHSQIQTVRESWVLPKAPKLKVKSEKGG